MTGQTRWLHSVAQDRADEIKAKRQEPRTEDVFDSRRPALAVVPPIACGHQLNDWVCVARQHPTSDHHYYVKAERA